MAKFQDCKGRDWILTITLGDIEPVRERTGVELNKVLGDRQAFTDLLLDPRKLANLIWVLCEDQVQGAGLTEAQFAKGFDGPTIERAMTATMEAVADFSPRSAAARAIKSGMGRIFAKMDEGIERRVEAALEAGLREMDTTSGPSSSTSPGSSGSTTAP